MNRLRIKTSVTSDVSIMLLNTIRTVKHYKFVSKSGFSFCFIKFGLSFSIKIRSVKYKFILHHELFDFNCAYCIQKHNRHAICDTSFYPKSIHSFILERNCAQLYSFQDSSEQKTFKIHYRSSGSKSAVRDTLIRVRNEMTWD